MGGIKGFFKELEERRKKQVVFFCASIVVLTALYLPAMNLIRVARENAHITDLAVVNDFEILTQIDGIEEEKGKLNINGWVTRLNSKNVDVDIVLVNDNGTDIKIADTKCFETESMRAEFGIFTENKDCGFQASLGKEELKKDVCYRLQMVLSYVEDNVQEETVVRKKIFSGKYLFNGEIYSYNPLTYEQPQIVDEFIRKVIVVKNLRHFDLETGCWVFEHENQLYLIVDKKFGLTGDRTQRMKFHVHTAQIEQLPLDRQQYGYESLDFFFAEREYTMTEDSGYKVAIADMPMNYKASWIELGMYEVGGAMMREMAFLSLTGEEQY